ncbi:MAG: hypothetical protein U5R31_08265 [Acidimicrobiia bacterium]|nr:hypothetical protein [Acidimicrobiia bacterium]
MAGAIAGVVVLLGDDAGDVVVADAEFPTALAPTPDGGFLYAERLTGRIREVTAEGELVDEPVAEVDLIAAEDDQRGLVGLAVDDEGRCSRRGRGRPTDGSWWRRSRRVNRGSSGSGP